MRSMAQQNRKPTTIIVRPEDQEIVDWLDDKVIAIRRSGGAGPREIDRSRLIFQLLRGIRDAEQAAGISLPPTPKKT